VKIFNQYQICMKYFFIFTLLCLFWFVKCDNGTKENVIESDVVWTFMFYEAADFSNAYEPWNDFVPRMRSGKNVNILVLRDTKEDSARLWFIDEQHEPQLLKEMGEINMASQAVLQNFIDSSKSWYPADHYILAMYGHGYAWNGACSDETNLWDNVSTQEMQKAISNAGGVDMLMFTAPCMMASLENIVQLRNDVDIYIGSENESGYIFWREAIGDMNDLLNSDPDITPEELSSELIDFIYDRALADTIDYRVNLTMSAMKTEYMENLLDLIDDLSENYRLNIDKFVIQADSIYSDLITFNGGTLLDLKSFCSLMKIVEEDSSFLSKMDSILFYMDKSLINECHWENFGDLGGVHVYFTNPAGYYDINYNNMTSLDFVKNSHWDNLVYLYYLRSEYH